jgi:hypothetical protein
MLQGFIFTGLLLVFIGLMVKKHPSLLAGYNTMSVGKKKKIDIEKVSTTARNILVLTGAATIDASVIMYFLKVTEILQVKVIAATIVFGLVILIIWANRIPKAK